MAPRPERAGAALWGSAPSEGRLSVRTRFAPSPTGDLHLGGAWTALASWVIARTSGGATVMRVEDIDTPRVVHGSAERILEDIAWLGLSWDEGPFWQSQRSNAYEAALSKLTAAGRTYPCDCSRADISRIASAPHPGEEVVYPGTCRAKDPRRTFRRSPAIRLRVDDADVLAFDDGIEGRVEQAVAPEVGDFVLRRGDGLFAYQLVVVVDDLAMRISDVVRGADLLMSTPRQILLARLLGHEAPRYWHVPLVVAGDGSRLEKRTAGSSIRELREAGVAAEAIVGELACGLGLVETAEPRTAAQVVELARRRTVTWRRAPWPIPATFRRA